MSRSSIQPLNVGAPEFLSLLHQRLLLAEGEAESLIQDMGALGVSRDQILGSAQRMDATQQRPVSPLKMPRVLGGEGMPWQQCDSLVSRVCRMESLLQTLRITVFRLETEKELDPSHTAHLKQQLAALQQESEEERQASRRELVKLRVQLQQAHQERDEARTKVQRLGETVEVATAAEMDVTLAAEELKIVKLEMSQKLMEMNERMRQDVKSHSELLQRVEEMEGAMEMERRQTLLLRSDRRAFHVQVQTSRQQLEEEKARGGQLEELCLQLKEQTAVKDSLVSEMKAELKAERSRVVKQLQDQELQLEADRRSVHTELQVALTDKVNMHLQLEKLEGEHARLLQSSSTAQETAVAQRELLERTNERLRGELNTAKREERAMRKHLESSKHELCLVVTKLEGERSRLETQLSEAKVRELEALQRVCVCGPAGGVSQTLENILASHTRLQLNSQTLQQELGGTLKKDRLQAQTDIRKHQAEVEKLQRLLTSTHSRKNRALQLDTAKVDNKRLAQSLERAMLTNRSLHSKLEQTSEQYQATINLRDEELREARTKISHLSEELGAVKQQTREDYESSVKMLHREISERLEERIRNLHDKEQTDSEPQEVMMDPQQVLLKQEAEWERWTSTIRRWEAKRELAHMVGGCEPAARTQLTTQSR